MYRTKQLILKNHINQQDQARMISKYNMYVYICTWELPWLARVQVNFHQGTLQNFLISDLFVKVMKDQLLITRVKPKPWGQ